MSNILATAGAVMYIENENVADIAWMIDGLDDEFLKAMSDADIETTVRHCAEMSKEYDQVDADEDDIQEAIGAVKKIIANR